MHVVNDSTRHSGVDISGITKNSRRPVIGCEKTGFQSGQQEERKGGNMGEKYENGEDKRNKS
jgi:hypothetical protein